MVFYLVTKKEVVNKIKMMVKKILEWRGSGKKKKKIKVLYLEI